MAQSIPCVQKMTPFLSARPLDGATHDKCKKSLALFEWSNNTFVLSSEAWCYDRQGDKCLQNKGIRVWSS